MRKGEATRERLLDIAEASVLAKGFGATSIEEIIAEAGITKSGFFYHFPGKNELAWALIVRYARNNNEILETAFAQAHDLADGDPLQALMIGLKLLGGRLEDMQKGHPGCLVSAIIYQERLFDRQVHALIADTVRDWNRFFETQLRKVTNHYPVGPDIDIAELAQLIPSVINGGIIMGRALTEPRMVVQHLMMVRSYLRLLFEPAAEARRAA